MKISIEPTNINKYSYYNKSAAAPGKNIPPQIPDTNFNLPLSNLSLVNFSNVSFKMNADAGFLLSQSRRLKCAYSGRDMIPLAEAKNIYAKLLKRPNAQSAINFLVHYSNYMHDVEGYIFDLFQDASHKGKKDFQSILQEHKSDALERLKEKQITILSSADKIIDTMSEPTAEEILRIKNQSIDQIVNNGIFGRKAPLDLIKSVRAPQEDLAKVIKVYQAWYKLPASSKDMDAFIVKYAKEPHNNIAKRLISTAVGSIEHIKPQQRSGEDKLGNYLLVSAAFNNNRQSMPLHEYIMLNPGLEIEKNLQKYMNDVIREVNNPKSQFAMRSYYPESIKKAVENETEGRVILDTSGLKISKAQQRQNNASDRLSQRYIVVCK